MKNFLIIIFLIIIYFGLSNNIYCKNYAILISGGYGINDGSLDAASWFDLVLAYEYLIEYAGFEHNDILVFFGDGYNWENTSVNNYRYKLSVRHPDWGNIVDFPNNDPDVLEDEIRNFADYIITDKDNLLIWLPAGHGAGDPDDPNLEDYAAWIQRLNDYTIYFSESNKDGFIFRIIYDLLKFEDNYGNKKYKRVKYLWSTCRSGHILAGNKTLLNGGNSSNPNDNKAIVIASCQINETGRVPVINNESHSGFTYGIYCTLMGRDPWNNEIQNFEPDVNNDGVISMEELWNSIKYNGASYLSGKSWDPSSSLDLHTEPQIGDPCPMASYLYIDENLNLENATLTLMQGEEIRKYRVDNITAGNNLIIPNGSKIEFIVDTKVKFEPGFHAQQGSRLDAFIGEIECP